MRILITGGCGNVGTHAVDVLSKQGHSLRVLDRDSQGLEQFAGLTDVETVAGDIADRDLVFKAVAGMDAIVHLAWSFSDTLTELLDTDVKGFANLLDAAVEHGVQQVVNTSTAVVYGKPQYSPVDEKHPRIVEKARKPMYALAKATVEQLGDIYAQKGLGVNTIMIWYAYGQEIGGKHIRGMVKDAVEKGVIEVPAGCGGSFLQLDDFVAGLEAIFDKKPRGQMYNLATVYMTWEELAQIITAKANPAAKVAAIPKDEWKGSSFLTDDWKFTTEKAEAELGFKTRLTREQAVADMNKALEACVAEVKAERA